MHVAFKNNKVQLFKMGFFFPVHMPQGQVRITFFFRSL